VETLIARRELIRGLQLAHSGELGAIRAYLGHCRSLRGRPERARLSRILKDEVLHRRIVARMLTELGSEADPHAEKKLDRIGRLISCVCFWTGWFIPMYGAARLENDNIVEYEILARLAWWAGLHDYIDELLHLGEVEWDHELWLRELASQHLLWRIAPKWQVPEPRASIRERFARFTEAPTTVERRKSILFR
jgi:hypothetical protein